MLNRLSVAFVEVSKFNMNLINKFTPEWVSGLIEHNLNMVDAFSKGFLEGRQAVQGFTIKSSKK